MKTFQDLTNQQKQDALDLAFNELVDNATNGNLDIKLVNQDSNKRLEKILAKSRKTESTRLLKLYLINDKPIREELYQLAAIVAMESQYDDNGDVIMGEKHVDITVN